MGFTARQMMAIQVSERSMSVLSILGSLFIMSTFLKWHYFRKPINRLVFFASFGNMLTNVATLISISALPGQSDSYRSLCELQGILIQWFMMADTLWVFSMALNVMLVFFRNYNSKQLLRLEKWYMLFSYGCPGLIAIAYIIMNHVGSTRQTIIGPATIWCWVGVDVAWMRLAFFYTPIWIIIGATMVIYITTGHQIFKKRAELRSFSQVPDHEIGNGITNPFTATDFRNIKVETEMRVETCLMTASTDQDTACPPSRSSFDSSKELSDPVDTKHQPSFPPRAVSRPGDGSHTGYKATAFATCHSHSLDGKSSRSISINHSPNKRRTAAMESNAAAWGYFKVAFLMFAALFMVWVPSSINRVQQFIDQNTSIFGLNLASALVLPLQGFWNSMIYISTTWPECKRAIADMLDSLSHYRNFFRRPWRMPTSTVFKRHSHHTSATNPAQGLEPPIFLATLNNRPESQRCLQSMSSAESVARTAQASSSDT